MACRFPLSLFSAVARTLLLKVHFRFKSDFVFQLLGRCRCCRWEDSGDYPSIRRVYWKRWCLILQLPYEEYQNCPKFCFKQNTFVIIPQFSTFFLKLCEGVFISTSLCYFMNNQYVSMNDYKLKFVSACCVVQMVHAVLRCGNYIWNKDITIVLAIYYHW